MDDIVLSDVSRSYGSVPVMAAAMMAGPPVAIVHLLFHAGYRFAVKP